MDLPALPDILSSPSSQDAPLAQTLSILFEPSHILQVTLVPQLVLSLTSNSTITSYAQLIDATLHTISAWNDKLRAQFISGHPRIGESKNLSSLSAKEQGIAVTTAAPPTSAAVLARLAHLNACYERRYPGLRYITFVNGRTRAVIAEEMEDILGVGHSLEHNELSLDDIEPVEVEGMEWKAELDRAVIDVGRIAKSRLGAFGVQ